MCTIISSAINDNFDFFSLFNFFIYTFFLACTFFFFSSLTALGRNSITKLKRNVAIGHHPSFVPLRKHVCYRFSFWGDVFLRRRSSFLFLVCFLINEFFIHFFCTFWDHHSIFLFSSVSTVNYMNLFSNIKPCFHSWDKPHTVMMYYILYVLLVSGCFLHVCSWIRSVYNFLIHSWASFGVKVMLSLI